MDTPEQRNNIVAGLRTIPLCKDELTHYLISELAEIDEVSLFGPLSSPMQRQQQFIEFAGICPMTETQVVGDSVLV